MSPTLAFHIITWVAILVLFLALAAVLREVRLLRGMVLRDTHGYAATGPDTVLGPRFAGRVVLAADTGCPLCVAAAERVAALAPRSVLLTHEPPSAWDGRGAGLEVVADREAWRAVAHLSPPVLMRVDTAGRVTALVLPTRVSEVDEALREWSTGAADVR